ncbi:MAG: carboxylesterase family protein [Chitinophagaceae bacterium]
MVFKKTIFVFFVSCLSLGTLLAQDSIVINSVSGAVKGVKDGDSWVFKGVPYAEKLTGATRFRPPVSKSNWLDTLDCRRFGDRAPQYGNKKHIVNGSENCLFLNIYMPTHRPIKKMPVLVWVHGGGMTNGQGADMDGRAFADKDGIVTVTINYRLGALGFLYLGDVDKNISGNNGLLDLMESLRFLRKNIAAYGGDPDRITVMGESAGAKLVSTLLLATQSDGLYSQLLLESGAIQCVRDTMTAKLMRQRMMDTLQLNNPADLLTVPLEQLVDAQNKVCGGAKGTNYFGPVADGSVIPVDFVGALEKRNLKNIRVLLGSNHSESRLFMNMDKRLYRPNEKILTDWFGENGSIADSAIRSKSADSLGYLLTEYMYAMHTHRLAKVLAEKNVPTWLYRFDYDPKGEGAAHAQELAYVWYRKSSGHAVANEPLAESVHDQWVNFIYGKTPEKKWQPFSTKHQMKTIGTTDTYQQNPVFYEDAQFPIGCFKLVDSPLLQLRRRKGNVVATQFRNALE